MVEQASVEDQVIGCVPTRPSVHDETTATTGITLQVCRHNPEEGEVKSEWIPRQLEAKFMKLRGDATRVRTE
jgi:hypothetical protein